MLALWVAARAAGQSCDETLVQDLNCNAVDAADELAVDLSDRACRQQRAPDGTTPPTADWYIDYAGYGCTIPAWEFDVDGDGFSDGNVSFPEGADYPDLSATLACDNCPEDANPDQQDADCDDVGDVCDNCVDDMNHGQEDADGDGVGDVCDPCPLSPEPAFADHDDDGLADACDPCPYDPDPADVDFDEDDAPDVCDVCPWVYDPDQEDRDLDGVGDACDACPIAPNQPFEDADQDAFPDACDVCPEVSDSQRDRDLDGAGDACDTCPSVPDADQADGDGDGVGDACDRCPGDPRGGAEDLDGDGAGDACDDCPAAWDPFQRDADADGVGDACDVCPAVPDPAQGDQDGDGEGDACDPILRGGGARGCDAGPGGAPALALLAALLLARRRAGLLALAACADPAPAPPPEVCGNGLDDDGDGVADCHDPDCADGCLEDCALPGDEEGDGVADCEDPDCAAACAEGCDDGRDDDEDGLVDCADPDCLGACPEDCRNGLDDDGDRWRDADDPECDDADLDGVPVARDCDDADPGLGAPGAWWADADRDGFGDPSRVRDTDTCEGPPGSAPDARGADCDDGRDAVHPGAPEDCGGGDRDCDGVAPACLAGALDPGDAELRVSGLPGEARLGLTPDRDGDRWPTWVVSTRQETRLFRPPPDRASRWDDGVPLAIPDGVPGGGDPWRTVVGDPGAQRIVVFDPEDPAELASIQGPPGFGRAVIAGDVDGDLYLDALVADDLAVTLLRGPLLGGLGRDAFAATWIDGALDPGIALADLDGDGFADLVVQSGDRVGVLTDRSGRLGFEDLPAVEVAGATGVAAGGDVDGDGLGDLCVSAPVPEVRSGGRRVAWVVGASAPACAPVPDLDGDGVDDLLVADRGEAWVFEGGRTGRLEAADAVARLSGVDPGAFASGDASGDGLGDLLFSATDAGRAFYGTRP